MQSGRSLRITSLLEGFVFLLILLPATHEYSSKSYYEPWNSRYPTPYRPQYIPEYGTESKNSPTWIRISQPRQIDRNFEINRPNDGDSGRHFKPETIFKITETLGALNTVGRYLVNVTRNGEPNNVSPEVPSALYTISKNVLGRNVTETLAPFVREALPVLNENTQDYTNNNLIPASSQTVTHVQEIDKVDSSNEDDDDPRSCTTPDGLKGYCDDLSNCPQLLLNLGNLRQSLCFKSLFVPGVCCPELPSNDPSAIPSTTTTTTTTRKPVTFAAIYYNTEKPTTVKPLQLSPVSTVLTAKPPINIPSGVQPVSAINNFIDPEDCGQPESAKFRVVGGEEALPGRWPWMAAIFLQGSRRTEFWCGGSLITSTHILTAAHCTRDSRQRPFAAHQFTVRLGDIDLKRDDEPSAPVTFKVAEIRAHDKFSRIGFYNDIAILKLDRRARKSRYVIPLCLPQPELSRESFAGRKTTVVGWGTTYYGGKESTVQRQAVLPIWRNEDCNDAYFQPITSNFICAGYSQGGADACQGDSGGPLMIFWDTRWMQIGVVSFGNKCGEPGYPGVYTRITEYMDWIKDNTRT